MATIVNSDNFVRAETDRMFHDLQAAAGGINRFRHNPDPASIDEQTVIRLNRDTLYSFGIVDLGGGAVVHLPDAGERYLSAMIVSNDHHVPFVLHDEGAHELTAEAAGSRYALVAVRILADPNDPADLAEVAALQHQVRIEARSAEPFPAPDYDAVSFDETRDALLVLARRLADYDGMFGPRETVDPVRHLIGTAAGWGGLPTTEATYVGRMGEPGRWQLVMRDVPVDAFWSISVYNGAGFFEPNERNAYSVNSVTGAKNDDGSITVRFGDFEDGTPNAIPTPEGWNLLVRLYRPRPEVLDRTWTVPELQPA